MIFSVRVNNLLAIGMFLGLLGMCEGSEHNNYWIAVPSAIVMLGSIGAVIYQTYVECKLKAEAFARFGDDIEGLNKWLEERGFERLDDEEEEIPDLEDANTPWILDVKNGKVYDADHDVVLTYANDLDTNYYKNIWVPNMKNIVNYVNEENWS